ncbi:MAG: uroporphyrinogen decarboxylase family protein [Candidatus Zhuqueibacterota bacterium]
MMTSRERVKRAIHFQRPDHIPHYLPDGGENDILWAAPWTVGAGLGPADIQPWTHCGDIDRRIDAWGVTWERSAQRNGDMGQAKRYPIEDIRRHGQYRFPDRNNPAYYVGHKTAIEDNNRSANPKYVLGVMGFSSLNEAVHNILGLETMFISYYEHPNEVKSLIARFADAQRDSIRLMADLGCDGVMGYDDWGLQNRLMIHRSLIEEFFMPHYRENWALAHALGLDVWLHSCGWIIDLLPTFYDAGLNVIQMDQQENMGLANLAERIGGRLAFWCPVDIQKTLAQGSSDEIERYVQTMMATIGRFNGGLISMAYTTPDAIDLDPVRVAAMCAAFRKYGIYDGAEIGIERG